MELIIGFILAIILAVVIVSPDRVRRHILRQEPSNGHRDLRVSLDRDPNFESFLPPDGCGDVSDEDIESLR